MGGYTRNRRTSGSAEWTGGYCDGHIHVASGSGPQMRRALAHEWVHACLSSLPVRFQSVAGLVQEGLAQKLSGDRLSASAREELHQLALKHTVPRPGDFGAELVKVP